MHRHKQFLIIFGAAFLAAAGTLLLLATLSEPAHASPLRRVQSTAAATTRYVATTGVDYIGMNPNPCIALACRTVQHAVDVADPGDEILVATGVYTGVRSRPIPPGYSGSPPGGVITQVVYISKSVTIRGGYAPWDWNVCNPISYPTTLNAEGSGRVLVIAGAISPTLEALYVTGGDANELGGTSGGSHAGGGIYSQDAAPIVVNTVISDNYGCNAGCTNLGRGGGVYLLNAPASAVVSGNLIADNVAANSVLGWGGGIMLQDSDAQILHNTLQSNQGGTAGNGGGVMVVGGSPIIADNDVLTNVAGTGVACIGGGIFVRSSLPVTIERNLIQGNKAINGTGDGGLFSRGGGIYFAGDPTGCAIIRDNTVRDNVASPLTPQPGEGGGMYLSGLVAPTLVSENTVEENVAGFNADGSGGGMYVNGSAVTIVDNHVASNAATWAGSHGDGGGLYVNGGTVLLQRNVITGNAAAFFGSPSTATGYGGGLFLNDSPAVLSGNTVQNNTASSAASGYGGGAYLDGSTATLEDNTVQYNVASAVSIGVGGGLYLLYSDAGLTGNTVQSNTASLASTGSGGGVNLTWSGATLSANTVRGNVAGAGSDGSGGGLYITGGRRPTLNGNTVQGNTASTVGNGYGGGLYLGSGAATLNGNVIVNNTATLNPTAQGGGGGLFVYSSRPFTLTNNVVADNHANTKGSGMWFEGQSVVPTVGSLLHTTIANNRGSGQGVFVHENTTLDFANTIVAGHAGVGITVMAGSTVTMEATLWHGNGADVEGTVSSSGDIYGDSAFAAPSAWDYHLTASSVAIDAGVDAGVMTDIDGDPRPIGRPDLGADEWGGRIYLPLVMRNHL